MRIGTLSLKKTVDWMSTTSGYRYSSRAVVDAGMYLTALIKNMLWIIYNPMPSPAHLRSSFGVGIRAFRRNSRKKDCQCSRPYAEPVCQHLHSGQTHVIPHFGKDRECRIADGRYYGIDQTFEHLSPYELISGITRILVR